MRLTDHMDARTEQQFRERALLGIAGVLVLLCLLLTIGWLNQDYHVVLQPPFPDSRYEIAADSANAKYVKAWGLFAASLVGNITPAREEFIVKSLSLILDSSIYRETRQALKAEAKNLLETGSSLTFRSNAVILEAHPGGPDRVFVTGERIEETAAGAVDELRVTYDFTIGIEHGRPVIYRYKLYEGDPHTIEWRRTHRKSQEDE